MMSIETYLTDKMVVNTKELSELLGGFFCQKISKILHLVLDNVLKLGHNTHIKTRKWLDNLTH